MQGNYQTFNISKSTPTTSTNNENTTSDRFVEKPSNEASNSFFGLPSKGSISASEPINTPIFRPTEPIAINSVSPTMVTVDNDSSLRTNTNLIGLFDKFDVKSGGGLVDTEEEFDEKTNEELKEEKDTFEYKEEPKTCEMEDKGPGNMKDSLTQKDQTGNGSNGSSHLHNDDDHEQEGLTQIDDSRENENENENENESKDSKQHSPSDKQSISDNTNKDNDNDSHRVNSHTKQGSSGNEEIHDISITKSNSSQNEVDEVFKDSMEKIKEMKLHESTQQAEFKDSLNTNGVASDQAYEHHQSHRPFDFQSFLAQLKLKSADPIVRYIRSFLVSFAKQGISLSTQQKIKIIKDFKIFMNEKFALYEPFASMDEVDLENSKEGLEKLLMNRLYEHCFPPEGIQRNHPDLLEDAKFLNQVEKFSWVNGFHLDVDIEALTKKVHKEKINFIDFATAELNKINNYRAPRDKIICILNSCKIIIAFLKTANKETNADAFVPLLILVNLKAKTKNLISNIHYIENYRGDEWLNHGETSYYLSSLQGAIEFIQKLSFQDLSISREEYDAHMEAWEAHEKQLARELEDSNKDKETMERNTLGDSVDSPLRGSTNLSQPIAFKQAQILPNFDNSDNSDRQMSLSPSSVLLNSAELVSKSISNFLSPSPQPGPTEYSNETSNPESSPSQLPSHISLPHLSSTDAVNAVNTQKTQEAFDVLVQMFPNLDKGVIHDLVHIKNGNLEECVDTCLELVSES